MWEAVVGRKIWLRNQATRKYIKELVQEGQDKGLPVKILNDQYVAFGERHIYIWKKGNIKKIRELIRHPTLESYGCRRKQ